MRSQSREIALSEGKPEKIVDKIVEGKVRAFCAENSLMEQEHVKVTKTKVGRRAESRRRQRGDGPGVRPGWGWGVRMKGGRMKDEG